MKKFLLPVFLLLSCNFFAQSFLEAYESTRHLEPFSNNNGTTIEEFNSLTGNPDEWSKIMGVFYEFDDIRFGKIALEGSVYLFKEWNNQAVVLANNKRYRIPNINFNIKQGTFISKIQGDSLFVYDFDKVERILVNNRVFKKLYSSIDKEKKIFEVLFESDKLSLLKSYHTVFIQASPNPMVNRPSNKIRQAYSYYIDVNGDVIPFKLNKSSFKKIVTDSDKKKMYDFVKKYNLTYSKESDAKKILFYVFGT